MSLKNKKILAGTVSLFLLLTIFLPSVTHAVSSADYTPLITCDGSKEKPCDFAAFVGTINKVINWIISIAGVIFTISAIWGGFLYMTSGDNPGNKAKAKTILWSTLTGFVIILVSWLIVFTILNYLVPTSADKSIFNFIGGR